MKRTDKDDKPESANNLVRYSGLFFQMFFIIGIFAIAGYKIDEAAENKQMIYTAALSLVGVVIAIYQVLKEVNQINNPK